MAAPGININLVDLTVFNPQITEPVVGMVGPATKGPVDQLTDITDVGTFFSRFGRPPAKRYYAQRAGERYLERGSNLKFGRVAGSNLATASLTLKAADGLQDVLLLTAAGGGAGTWANGKLEASVTHNGTASYNVLIYFDSALVEQYVAVDNGNVATRINNESTRVRVSLGAGAGATFPGETTNSITLAVDRLPFAGGNDGALAGTDSAASSTSGVAGRRFYGKMDSTAGSRVFENLLTIDSSIATKTEVYGTLGMAAVPGSFTIRVQTGAATFVELADDGDESYGSGGAGLGLLIPAAGTHRGFIDYRTGSWGVQLTGGAAAHLTGTIDAIWVRANSESAGATTRNLGTYSGTLSGGSMGVGYYNANKVVITVPVDEQVGDVPTAAGTGTSSAAATLKTLAGWVVPGTVKLTPSHATDAVPPAIYDDGFGGFRTAPGGGGVVVASATINYRTGAWSVPTWDPVGSVSFPSVTVSQLQAEYDIQVIDMGGGAVAGATGLHIDSEVLQAADPGGGPDASNADAGAVVVSGPYPFLPGNLKLVISDVGGSPETYYDDGRGGWLTRPCGDPRAAAATAGAIDYDTGAWSITASGNIAASASITVDYVRTAPVQARRALRGTGPQFIADTTANAAGMDLTEPAAANGNDGLNFLDHATGEFKLSLSLITTGVNTFNVKDNGVLTAVYAPADILGFGDGSTTKFSGALKGAPFRREANRLQAFQGAAAAAAGAGDAQVTFSGVGASVTQDHWLQNVSLSTDPDNTLDYRDGATSVEWSSAPVRDEASYVVAEEIVLHLECLFPGDIGNERPTITDGLYAELSADTTLNNADGSPTLKLQVFFDGVLQESFGQAADLEALALSVNDSANGSSLVMASTQAASTYLLPDLESTQRMGMGGAFTMADVIGAKVGQSYTGLQLFRNFETVNVDFIMVPGQWHASVIAALQTLCETPGRRCIGVIPAPDLDDPLKFRDFYNGAYHPTVVGGTTPTASATVPYPPLVEINSSQMATIMPWVQNFDPTNNVSQFEPPEGEILRLVASTPKPWFPVAGYRRGQVVSELLRFSASKEDRDLIQGLVGSSVQICNPITRRSGRGLFLLGQQTAYRTPGSVLGRLSVRWTLNLIMNLISTTSLEFLFEINDPILWREATARLNAILQPIVERRGLQDAHVVIDKTTVTSTDIDRLAMPGKLFIKPSLDVEQVEFDLVLTPQGADFSEVVVG